MSDQTSEKLYIQSEELVYNRPAAESTMKKIGGSVNYLLDTTDTNTAHIATNAGRITTLSGNFQGLLSFTPTVTDATNNTGASEKAFANTVFENTMLYYETYGKMYNIAFKHKNSGGTGPYNYIFYSLPPEITVIGYDFLDGPFFTKWSLYSSSAPITSFKYGVDWGIYNNKLWVTRLLTEFYYNMIVRSI